MNGSVGDSAWMDRALELAVRAESEGEVPVGALLVLDNRLVGEGWNQVISRNDPSAHAEILALRDAGQAQGNYRLPGASLYVTLEPCAMCLAASLHARLDRIVFAASDPKTGALGGAFEMPSAWAHNHELQYQGGVRAEQASELLRAFFRKRRRRAKRDAETQL